MEFNFKVKEKLTKALSPRDREPGIRQGVSISCALDSPFQNTSAQAPPQTHDIRVSEVSCASPLSQNSPGDSNTQLW